MTIEHKFGATRIAASPRRVVTVGYNDQDFVLALGITPLGVREWIGDKPRATWTWAQDELGDAKPAVLSSSELNFEQIAALRPDLILSTYSGITDKEYGRLSKIAPTVAQPGEFVDFGVPWQEQTRIIGRALGRQQRAEQVVEQLEARFAKTRAAHPEFRQATAAFAYNFEGKSGSFGAYGAQDPRVRFMTALGFDTDERIDKLAADRFFTPISGERLRLLDQDVLIIIGPTPDRRRAIEQNKLYGRLSVVRKGAVIYLDMFDEISGAVSFNSPLSLPFAIDELVPRLVAAVDADPATKVAEAK